MRIISNEFFQGGQKTIKLVTYKDENLFHINSEDK